MNDTKFFKLIGVVLLLIAGINFYVCINILANTGIGLLDAAMSLMTFVAGVITTVIGGKFVGVLIEK